VQQTVNARGATAQMKVLVTGHNGYIGSVAAPMLQEAGHDVTGLDTYFYEGCDFIPDEHRWARARARATG
jgi:nucleoside-diphosphate-sugar epimerase